MSKIELTEKSEYLFEQFRIYRPDSEMYKVISPKIREVFGRLFRNTDINLDNFYFTGYDENEVNAFKLRDDIEVIEDGIKKKKKVIAVSLGLIRQAKRHETFAAVLGHEAGHSVWADLIGGDNNTIQEQGSDSYSVKMMVNGGYNPQYVSVMQTELLRFTRSYNSEFTLKDVINDLSDVHGPDNSRMDVVNYTLKTIAMEQGRFPSIENDASDKEWLKFQKDVENVYKKEPYNTYIDKELIKKFGTKDLDWVDSIKFLRRTLLSKDARNFDIMYFIKMILGRKKSDNLEKVGMLDFLQLIKDMIDKNENNTKFFNAIIYDLCVKTPEYKVIIKSEQEKNLIQDIILKLIKKTKFLDKNYLKAIKTIIKNFNLKVFGPFQEQYKNIENLIKNCYDKEKSIYYAKKIYDLRWTVDYAEDFDVEWPALKPLGKDNIGKKFPWVQLKSYNDENINKIFDLIYFDSHFDGPHYSRKVDFDKDEYYIENNIITLYGDDIRQKNLDDFIKQIKTNINKKIDLFDSFAQYLDGKISKNFIYKKIYEYKKYEYLLHTDYRDISTIENFQTQVYKFDKLIHSCNLNYSELKELYYKIIKSDFYNKFIFKQPEMSEFIDVLNRKENTEKFQSLISFFLFVLTPINFEKFTKNIVQACLTLKDTNVFSDISEVADSCFYHLDDLLYIDYDKNWKIPDDNIDNLRKKRQIKQKRTKEIIKEFYPDMVKNSVNDIKSLDVDVPYLRYYIDNFLSSKNNSSNLIEQIFKNIGLSKMPQNEAELIESMKLLSPQCALILLAIYIKNGHKFHIKNILNMGTFLYRGYRHNEIPAVSDILAEYINVDEFNSLDLMDKISLYEFMEEYDLFSEKYANNNKYIKIIVDDIVKTKDKYKFDYLYDISEKILSGKNISEYGKQILSGKDKNFEFIDERNKLCEFCARYYAGNLGVDDGSDHYLNLVQNVINLIKKSDNKGKQVFSDDIVKKILDGISVKVLAQERAAKMFGDAAKYHIDANKIEDYNKILVGGETLIELFTKSPEISLAVIQFLSIKLSDKSIQTLIDSCDLFFEQSVRHSEYDIDNYKKLLNKSTLTLLYENVWNMDLKLRAVVFDQLLDKYAQGNDNKKLDLVVDMYFDKDSVYYNDAKIVLKSVYKNFQSYEKSLMLAALLGSGKKEDKSGLSNAQQVGRGLKMFFQNEGGAFIKFGQMLSYLSSLDSEICNELSTLRDRANIPTRDEIFDIIKQSVHEDIRKDISYVGKVLGGGSIYLTVQIKYKGKDCVIALMRPNTKNIIMSGIDLISNSINDMTQQDAKFEPLKNIVNQARASCSEEIDIKQDLDKYLYAIRVYEALQVKTKDAKYSTSVARWLVCGANNKIENSYKIMEIAPGKALTSDEIDEEDKHDMAIAYVTLELAILLSGARWDTDRHAGQQNFYEKLPEFGLNNDAFRDFCIGIFDTGAQMSHDTGMIDKVMLGHLFYKLILGVRTGKNISSVLNDNVQNIDSFSKKLGIDSSYIDGVQRGILALSDIIEYQKEIKDENGNIIQESKSLTKSELQNIIIAVASSGIIDKKIVNTVKANILISKLRKKDPGLLNDFKKLDLKSFISLIVDYDKTKAENYRPDIIIRDIQTQIDENEHMGIDITRIDNGIYK